jgi:hypothetical protein
MRNSTAWLKLTDSLLFFGFAHYAIFLKKDSVLDWLCFSSGKEAPTLMDSLCAIVSDWVPYSQLVKLCTSEQI